MPSHGRRDQGEGVLIAALLQGQTLAEAAQASHLSERTVRRRLADPAFVRELQQARQRAVGRAVNVLVDGTTTAAVTLRWLASHAEQEHVRLAAARSILDFAFRGLETLDLAERIAQLEARVATSAPVSVATNGRHPQWS
jgi:hypothetical protein